ncbi:MAG: hypothetical protein HQL52_19815 [Magnetococcales bacterium]|nr:hypothetical protein [Magnetococcales bacterium]
MDFANRWHEKTEITLTVLIGWVEISRSKFHYWRQRYGQENNHNGRIPRGFWLEDWERQAIIAFFHEHPLKGYRRLTYMMMDAVIDKT